MSTGADAPGASPVIVHVTVCALVVHAPLAASAELIFSPEGTSSTNVIGWLPGPLLVTVELSSARPPLLGFAGALEVPSVVS